jgi:hypothetical protein
MKHISFYKLLRSSNNPTTLFGPHPTAYYRSTRPLLSTLSWTRSIQSTSSQRSFKILLNRYPSICLKHFQEVSSFRFYEQIVVCISHVIHTWFDVRCCQISLFHHPDCRHPGNVTVESPYARNETNLMHYLSSVYLVTIPLKFSDLLVAHHQEVTMCIILQLGSCIFKLWQKKDQRNAFSK